MRGWNRSAFAEASPIGVPAAGGCARTSPSEEARLVASKKLDPTTSSADRLGNGEAENLNVEPRARKLLVLDLAYTLEQVQQRGQARQILYRDLGGFFDHVWSVHPFATLLTSDGWGRRYGRPEIFELAPRHTVIEGKVGRFSWL